eukprot:TRINITY_DN2434_c0_g1_i2.p1 TRINITY_DN2434_c0_g1~~TRINITY_DN2434_c0_g1_i2.p1  ORF type:complete len:67 (+),score=22.25 TRINITY_DN2434_c0_g1_i2:94-294(+)
MLKNIGDSAKEIPKTIIFGFIYNEFSMNFDQMDCNLNEDNINSVAKFFSDYKPRLVNVEIDFREKV